MHFEILVEDASGKVLLESIVPKILGDRGKPHTYRIVNIQELKHRVMARMPRHLARTLPWDTILYQTLAIQLKAYGKSLDRNTGVVIVLVDVDYHDKVDFLGQLKSLFESCAPAPGGDACLAMEEGEAWLLGDPAAVRRAYPLVKEHVLTQYEQDSICGTWECLADAIHHGGYERLEAVGYPHIGKEKCRWAENIGQYMDVERNKSPSFLVFRDTLRIHARNGAEG